MDFRTDQWLGMNIPGCKITINPDYSITFEQEIPPTQIEWDGDVIPTPPIQSFTFAYVKGQGQWMTLAVLGANALVNGKVTWTSQPCLVAENVQYAAGCNVLFQDPYYIQATGFSTTFVNTPGLTWQGGVYGTTGTAVPADGSCTGTVTPTPAKGKGKRR